MAMPAKGTTCPRTPGSAGYKPNPDTKKEISEHGTEQSSCTRGGRASATTMTTCADRIGTHGASQGFQQSQVVCKTAPVQRTTPQPSSYAVSHQSPMAWANTLAMVSERIQQSSSSREQPEGMGFGTGSNVFSKTEATLDLVAAEFLRGF